MISELELRAFAIEMLIHLKVMAAYVSMTTEKNFPADLMEATKEKCFRLECMALGLNQTEEEDDE
jgi:hypothetical protein